MQRASPIYLSIDLDVFSDTTPDSVRHFQRLFEVVTRRDRVFVCMSHEKMLPRVNASKARTLWNLDFHLDLSDDTTTLECGNWVNYVDWQRNGAYVWLHRHEKGMESAGYCHSFCRGAVNHLPETPWRSTRMRRWSGRILWDRVIDVGVCVSPDCTRPKVFRELVEKASPSVYRWFFQKHVCSRAQDWVGTHWGQMAFGWD